MLIPLLLLVTTTAATAPQTDIVAGAPLAIDADIVAFAADVAAIPRRPDPRGLNMLAITLAQAAVDHNLVFTPGVHAGTCLPAPPGIPYFADVSCFPLPAVGPNPQNEVPAPHLRAFFVYGDGARADALRERGAGGEPGPRLRVDAHRLPPKVGDSGLAVEGHPPERQFLVGDKRGGETSFLTAVHTVWLRRHNELADKLGSYEAARGKLEAEVDAVVFGELLPALIGPYADCAGVPAIDAVDKTFSGAILRIHSMVNPAVIKYMHKYGVRTLADVFFDPTVVDATHGDLTGLLTSLYHTPAHADTLTMADDLNRHLFHRQPGPAFSLVVANLRRSVDLGLADFNAARVAVGLEPYAAYEDFVDDPAVLAVLRKHFPGGPSTCPVWVCARAERAAAGSSLGETASVWFRQQLCGLRRPPREHATVSFAYILCRSAGTCWSGDTLHVPEPASWFTAVALLGALGAAAFWARRT